MELAGIATTMTGFIAGRVRLVNPPRATATELPSGSTLGHAGDAAQQLRVLTATLDLLALDAPVPLVKLDEE